MKFVCHGRNQNRVASRFTTEEPSDSEATGDKETETENIPEPVVAASKTESEKKEAEIRKQFQNYDADKSGYDGYIFWPRID